MRAPGGFDGGPVSLEGGPPLRVGMSTTIEIDTGHRRSIGDIFRAIGL